MRFSTYLMRVGLPFGAVVAYLGTYGSGFLHETPVSIMMNVVAVVPVVMAAQRQWWVATYHRFFAGG